MKSFACTGFGIAVGMGIDGVACCHDTNDLISIVISTDSGLKMEQHGHRPMKW
jgi:hypothetical protein